MEKCEPGRRTTTAVEVARTTCTDMASYLLEKFGRMRETLDRIEGTNSDRDIDEDPGPGSLPLLELQLNMANKDAVAILERIDGLATRI